MPSEDKPRRKGPHIGNDFQDVIDRLFEVERELNKLSIKLIGMRDDYEK